MDAAQSPSEVTPHPFDTVLERLHQLGGSVRFLSPEQVRATCPAHRPDTKPSLSVKRVERGVLLHCHAGCSKYSLLQALGMRLSDLFVGPRPAQPRRVVAATYEYHNSDGTLVARKKRFTPKAFCWERPDPAARGGWRLGRDPEAPPGLYRLLESRAASLVFLVEGEKAVERLRALGAVATCGTAGASVWKEAWSADLITAAPTAAFAILPDNDLPGRRHAERVAASIAAVQAGQGGHAPGLKVVSLAGLADGGDVVDWFDAGHTFDELQQTVADTPTWTPDAAALARRARRTDQARLRMRRHRERQRGGSAAALSPTRSLQDAEVISAVVSVLPPGVSLSGRAVKVALKHRFPRQRVEKALTIGVELGVLTAQAVPRCRAVLYARATDIRCVTADGTARTGVPTANSCTERVLVPVPSEIPVSPCPVTPFAVTQGVRISTPLQETLIEGWSPCVTPGGTLAFIPNDTGSTPQDSSVVDARMPVERHHPSAPYDAALSTDHLEGLEAAIAEGRCCGRPGSELRCKLCRWSPTYAAILRQDRRPHEGHRT